MPKTFYAIEATLDYVALNGKKTVVSRKLFISLDKAEQYINQYLDEIVERTKGSLYELERNGAKARILDFVLD